MPRFDHKRVVTQQVRPNEKLGLIQEPAEDEYDGDKDTK